MVLTATLISLLRVELVLRRRDQRDHLRHPSSPIGLRDSSKSFRTALLLDSNLTATNNKGNLSIEMDTLLERRSVFLLSPQPKNPLYRFGRSTAHIFSSASRVYRALI